MTEPHALIERLDKAVEAYGLLPDEKDTSEGIDLMCAAMAASKALLALASKGTGVENQIVDWLHHEAGILAYRAETGPEDMTAEHGFSAEALLDAAAKIKRGEHLATPPREVVALIETGSFLLDRIEELDWSLDLYNLTREWDGHVEPALARFRSALTPAPPTAAGEQGEVRQGEKLAWVFDQAEIWTPNADTTRMNGPAVATALRTLQAEVERLVFCRDADIAKSDTWQVRSTAAEARERELREALEKIAKRAAAHPDETDEDRKRNLYHVAEIARQALAPKEPSDDRS